MLDRKDTLPMERRVSARLASARLEVTRGGTQSGRERSAPMVHQVLVRLELARLNASGRGTHGGEERNDTAYTVEMAAMVDGARGRQSGEAERSEDGRIMLEEAKPAG